MMSSFFMGSPYPSGPWGGKGRCPHREAGPSPGRAAEVDGNRTRRTGIARPTRFEGGGAHQVPGHLRLRH